MFILTNTSKELPFEISTVNGRTFLRAAADGVLYKGTEANLPCNYYVVESNEDVVDASTAEEAKVMVIETIFETGVSQGEASYDSLILSFGSRRMAELVARRELNGEARAASSAKFVVKSQLLPPMNEDAGCVEEYFTLETMFPQDVLEAFSKLEPSEATLHSSLLRLKQKRGLKLHFLLADCIIKLLEKKYILSDCLSETGYESFYRLIVDDVESRRLTPLGRDRLAVLCYILLLNIEGFTLHYASLPSLGMPKIKVINLFKTIGCSYSPSKNEFKLVGRPREASSVFKN
jgi:hypothetical protein